MQYGAELYTCKVCLKDPLEKVSSMQDLPMFLPHELVGAIYNYGWAIFSSVFLGGLPAGILRVWGHLWVSDNQPAAKRKLIRSQPATPKKQNLWPGKFTTGHPQKNRTCGRASLSETGDFKLVRVFRLGWRASGLSLGNGARWRMVQGSPELHDP
jgi:hypothetical protein